MADEQPETPLQAAQNREELEPNQLETIVGAGSHPRIAPPTDPPLTVGITNNATP